MATVHSKPSSISDHTWDAFVASLHRVWEYAPDFSPNGPINLSCRTILVVDSKLVHNDQISERLKRLGSLTISVDSIHDAYKSIEVQNFDMVVISTDLLDEDAIHFIQTVCDTSSTLNMPIIMLTNDERPEMVWKARKAGVKFYLRKPYDPYVLLTLISAALEPSE